MGAEPFGEMSLKKRGRFCGEVESEVKSQEAKTTSCPEQFWKFICWKTAWRCGAKAMRNAEGKIRTPFWCEALVEGNSCKTHYYRNIFGS